MLQLKFYGWRRSGVYAAIPQATLTAQGRLTGALELTLKNVETLTDQVNGSVAFELMGPGDVAGLALGSITRVVPPKGARDAEADKCVFVEFSRADLPWRYTPKLAANRALQPWLALIVGTRDEIHLLAGGHATFDNGFLHGQYPLARSARWAHVQEEPGHPDNGIARLLSERKLQVSTEYLAVVVPAFTKTGQPAWTAESSPTLPIYYSWSFRTGSAGGFAEIAADLEPGDAPADLGRASLRYEPLPDVPLLSVRGALAPLDAMDEPLPLAVATDLEKLTASQLIDPRRPTIQLPVYGAPWTPDPLATTWGAVFRGDPRHRGAAGLGAWLGIQVQDHLSEVAGAQAGALLHAAQRVRQLTAGLSAARSLWKRRRPQDANRRLALLGPSLRRTMTKQGLVIHKITGPGRPLPCTLFSSAARRVLRSGPARTKWAQPGANDPREIVTIGNTCAPLPLRAPLGLPHLDGLAEATGTMPLDQAWEIAKQAGRLSLESLKALVDAFDPSPYPKDVVDLFSQVMAELLKRASMGTPIPLLALVELLDPSTDKAGTSTAPDLWVRLQGLLELPADGILSGAEFPFPSRDEPLDRPCLPFPERLPAEIDKTVDPTDQPFIVEYVLGAIEGLGEQRLKPPELCPDLDIPVWQLLRDHAPDWLLPGVQQLGENSVVAVQTNPIFVEAVLLGLNAQILGELRFRNLPIIAGCTPLRQFWSLADEQSGTFVDDIEGVHRWSTDSPLGSPDHRPAGSVQTNLVLVFRTPLFRHYPRTLVYLVPTLLQANTPKWDEDLDVNARLLPTFQGSIGSDIVYFAFGVTPQTALQHWVVLEEPPHDPAFFNTAPSHETQRSADMVNAADGASFAAAAFADPIRVVLRGDALIPGGA